MICPAAAPARAQSYPTKAIKLVVPFGPGGPTDVAARLIAQVVPAKLGQSIVIENRAEGGTRLRARLPVMVVPRFDEFVVTHDA